MNYWLTTHWQPFVDQELDVEPGVWMPEGRESAGIVFDQGDVVLIYQSRSGRTLVEKAVDGTTRLRRRRVGKAGIVAVGVATTPFHALEDDEAHETYADGTEIWWRWYANLRLESRSGFVPRDAVASALGYKTTYNFHGFGDCHSGLKRLTEAQYEALLAAFKRDLPRRLPKTPRTPHAEGGPESDAHRLLKEYVANDPAVALHEDGLRTVHVEYAFPTQDRADLVLEDRFGRIIGAEVEVDCERNHVCGILQAVKYRRMLEVLGDRVHNDGRAMLIAYTVAPEVRAVCARYEVEVHEVPRDVVANDRSVE